MPRPADKRRYRRAPEPAANYITATPLRPRPKPGASRPGSTD